MEGKKLVAEHISEIRNRTIICISIFAIGVFYGFYFSDTLIYFSTSPLHQPLYYSSPAGGVAITFKIAIYFGLIVALPVITYHIIKFLQPAFENISDQHVLLWIYISYFLMLSGMTFAYFAIIPASLSFLNDFSSPQIEALITADNYFSFIGIYLLAFAIFFQLPLILLIVNKVNRLSPKLLLKQEKIVILASFIVAAVISPTVDVVNQFFIAIPLIFLYQVSIIIIWFSNRIK